MALPWTGLHLLLDPDALVTWEDFAYIVDCIRQPKLSKYYQCELGRTVLGAISFGVWRFANRAVDTPPRAKIVGKLLAQAVNGMLAEGGWNVQLDSPGLPLLQEMQCPVRVQPGLLPVEAEVGRVVHSGGYPFIILGSFEDRGTRRGAKRGDNGVVRIGLHRLVCWLAHGDPPTPSHECLHACRYKACVRPACLKWGTHAENMASPQAGRKRRRCENGVLEPNSAFSVFR